MAPASALSAFDWPPGPTATSTPRRYISTRVGASGSRSWSSDIILRRDQGAVDDVKLGNITAFLKNFHPALATLNKADGKRDLHNDPLVQKVAEANARLTAASLTKRSPIIKALVDARQLKIPAAMHDVSTGKVTWLLNILG